MADELNELQKEWRAIVLEKLSTLATGQSQIQADIVEIKTSFVRQQSLDELQRTYQEELDKLKGQIDDLKAFKYKLIGITIGANAVLAVLSFVIEYAMYHGR